MLFFFFLHGIIFPLCLLALRSALSPRRVHDRRRQSRPSFPISGSVFFSLTAVMRCPPFCKGLQGRSFSLRINLKSHSFGKTFAPTGIIILSSKRTLLFLQMSGYKCHLIFSPLFPFFVWSPPTTGRSFSFCFAKLHPLPLP